MLPPHRLQLLRVEFAEALFPERIPEEAQTCGVLILAVAMLVKEALDGRGDDVHVLRRHKFM